MRYDGRHGSDGCALRVPAGPLHAELRNVAEHLGRARRHACRSQARHHERAGRARVHLDAHRPSGVRQDRSAQRDRGPRCVARLACDLGGCRDRRARRAHTPADRGRTGAHAAHRRVGACSRDPPADGFGGNQRVAREVRDRGLQEASRESRHPASADRSWLARGVARRRGADHRRRDAGHAARQPEAPCGRSPACDEPGEDSGCLRRRRPHRSALHDLRRPRPLVLRQVLPA